MKRPLISEHNSQTNEVIKREMNDEEFFAYEENKKQYTDAEAKAEAKAAQRQTILDRLGLTSEEAALLLS